MCGDGGFSMLMGDFLSVVQMKLPVKIIVFNNSVLGFVAMEMKAGGYLTDGTELHDTNLPELPNLRHYGYPRRKKRLKSMKPCNAPSPSTVRCWWMWWSPKKN